MKKRLQSFLLAALLVISAAFYMAPRAAAAQMTTSEEGIALIKAFEGFVSKPYYDYGQYSVGYGTACKKGDYPNGITEEQADQLLREHLVKIEKSLNSFAAKHGVTLSQQKFDALISFTYNLGTGWMNEASTFRSAVISGKTGNDFLFAITRWSAATKSEGMEIMPGLVQRRLAEANVYLNGIYSKTVPADYRYVIFYNNIDNAVNDVRIQGFDARQTDAVRATPTKPGYRFLGWYTKANGGEWVTSLGSHTTVSTLYGHWQKGEGDAVNGTAAEYVRVATAGQAVCDAPGGNELRTLNGKEGLSIVADYVDASGIKWGKLSIGGWVDLNKTDDPNTASAGETVSIKVQVTASDVNVRSGPGTNYTKVGKAQKGQELTITNVRQGGQYLWGQFSDGWICLDYTDYELAMVESAEDANVVTAVGVVIKTDKLNIRSRPTTSSDKVGTYAGGETIYITLQQKVGSSTWGKTDKGWVSLYYVQVTPVEDGEIPDQTPNPTQPPAEPDPTEPEATEPPAEQKPSVIDTGVVVDCTKLNVRKAAGTSNVRVGQLAVGTKVEILEKTTVNGTVWGRISQGWISLDYVKLDSVGTGKPENTGPAKPETGGSNATVKTGVITGTSELRVRSAPGVNNKQVGTMKKGQKVVILETAKVGNATWGRTEKGWIHMYYVRLDGAEVPSGTIVRTVTATSLRIRSGAGTSNAAVGSYTKGTQVVITEQTLVNGRPWGKTDKGWISLDYVK